MEESVEAPYGDSGTLVLEGYNFVKSLGETVLSRSGLYFEHSSNSLVVVEEIAAEISQIPGFDDRFQDRLALVAPCVHPNLIRLQPGGFTHHGRYYVMREHVEGHTLQHWMQNAELDPARVHQIILSLAGALEEFHRHGLVHSAMNAAHIWMDRDDLVKLEICPVSSFLEPKDLVRLLGLEVVNAMPPEFTTGAIPTPQSDIYALATLYYELLTGTAPRGIITRLSSSLKVDIRVSSVILKALSQNPQERQTSIAEFCAPLLGNAAINTQVTQEGQRIAQGTSSGRLLKIFIAAAILLSIGASVGSYFAWQAYQQKKNQSVPVTVTNEVKTTEEVDVPSVAILPRLGWVGIEGNANHALMELVLMNSEEIKSLCTPQSALNAETPVLPPVLTQYLFEDETGKALCEPKAINEKALSRFSLSLNLTNPTPQSLCLVLKGPDDLPLLKSNFIVVSDAIADHRLLYAPSVDAPPEPPPSEDDSDPNPRVSSEPAVLATAGDAYFYAAHFYLGNDVSLLKLEFGNVGKYNLMMSQLTFQCAFSIDDTFDELLKAEAGALPTLGKDLAAGGFTSKWLGMDALTLPPGKKVWTQQTFRIDTSNPDLLNTAKYLLVKVNHLHLVAEANYKNNVIVIPLEHREQWHSVTQDPTDTETTDAVDPATTANPAETEPK